MEEENSLNIPYYEMTYLDDYDIKHYAKVYDKNEADYLGERYAILQCNLVNEEN